MSLLDLLFPPRCGGCHAYGAAWCSSCAASVEPVAPAALGGIPLIAGGRFSGPLQRAIHTYKYAGRRGLAADLAQPLLDAIRRGGARPNHLMFVPLHPERQRQRGFNQAERIAAQLGMRLGLPVADGLARIRPTRAQVGLAQAEREENVVGAFSWTAAGPPPERVGLVDDVCTTGATLQAAAHAIRLAGGSVAAFLVVARAQTFPGPVVTSAGQPACL